MSMSRILVTGATGQIGSELAIELRRKYGANNVVAGGHKRKPNETLLQSGPFEYVDVTNKENIEKVVRDYHIDTLYHLASVLLNVSEQMPKLAWQVNVGGLYNILEVAREYGVARVFWPSSIAVFGPEAPHINTPQRTRLIPRTIYGVTKVAGELLCNYYFAEFGLDVRSIRYPGIVSSDIRPREGTTDYVIEIFHKAIRKERYVCFLREDTTLPLMYLPDCIKATTDLMEADSSRIRSRISYNVAAMSFSVGELVAEIKKYIPEFRCDYKPDFRQKIADSWPQSIDDSVACEEWGWKPDYDLYSMTKDMLVKLTRGSMRAQ